MSKKTNIFFTKPTNLEHNKCHCCCQILTSTNLVSCVTLSVTLEENEEYLQHCVCHIVLKLMLFEKKTYDIARLQRVSLKTGNEELKMIVVKIKTFVMF